MRFLEFLQGRNTCRTADAALTILGVWAIIKTQGDACGNKHLPVAKPRRLPQHKTYRPERLALKTVSRSAANRRLTSFFVVFLALLIKQIKHERHDAANRTDGSEHSQKCRSYMYRLPGNRFPVKAAYTPPFRFHGMAGNRLLPHTVYKGEKRKADGGVSRNPLYG